MQIEFKTKLQHHIADLMWNAQDLEKVNSIKSVYGKEAEVVFNMIMASYFDEDMSIDMSAPIIQSIKEKL